MNPLKRNAGLRYFNVDGSPCCIFGHVLERLGLPSLAGIENLSVDQLPWERLGVEPPNPREQQWVLMVQNRADQYSCWPMAVAYADGFALAALA